MKFKHHSHFLSNLGYAFITPPPFATVVTFFYPLSPFYCINYIDFSGLAKFCFGAKLYLPWIINYTYGLEATPPAPSS